MDIQDIDKLLDSIPTVYDYTQQRLNQSLKIDI